MAGSQSWLDAELAGSTFADERLGKRLRVLLERMGGAVGESLPMALPETRSSGAASPNWPTSLMARPSDCRVHLWVIERLRPAAAARR